MIVLTKEKNDLIAKMYHNGMGYHFKIFYNRQLLLRSYVHLTNRKLCEERMTAALDNYDRKIKERLKNE